jgi:hypothetical protein
MVKALMTVGRVILLLVGAATWPLLGARAEHDKLSVETRERGRSAAQMCQRLRGYEWFKSEFAFDKEATTVGYINSFDHSLFVQIQSKQPRLVDAARWWNPLGSGGQPRYDWHDFRSAYLEAAAHVARHTWIAEWKQLGHGRGVEVQLFGTGIGERAFELKTFHIPVWKDAGFSGRPTYSVLLRRPNGGSVSILLGRSDRRALAIQNFLRPGDDAFRHWADTLPLAFHPKGHRDEYYSKSVVIAPTGGWKLHTYTHALPRERKKRVNASYTGGDGSSFARAVIVRGVDHVTVDDAKLSYIDRHFHELIRGRSDTTVRNSRTYDVAELHTPEGAKRTLYFDITAAYASDQ